MTNKEIQDILDELNNVRPEKLNKEAKRLYEAIMTIADERDKYKNIVEKASKDLNITPEMLIAEFDRLEDLEDDREQLKWRLKEEKENYDKLTKHFIENHISKDKIRDKIKEYKGLKEIDKMAYEEQIKPLQELLEEE